ncbi:hemophore-related protein [Nocardia mexicana]|uniref:Hemophore-related protein n=1 Tax=Nocardia mexicana TaxID=279262 RepID=A0A370HCH9_9NOCA|nr:hemophore-related protein [Nocardia mexicana]RDI54085.1 hemophore-related protein [Nocardia mexicana]
MSVTKFAQVATLVAVAFAGVAVASGTASAQPGERHPLADSTCSAAQVEAAMRDHAPGFATYLDEHPDHRAKFQHMLSIPPEQRKVIIRERGQGGPELHEGPGRVIFRDDDPRFADMPRQMRVVADTCHGY